MSGLLCGVAHSLIPLGYALQLTSVTGKPNSMPRILLRNYRWVDSIELVKVQHHHDRVLLHFIE